MKCKNKRSRMRNPLYDHPLMCKGGVHEKSERVKRHIEKQKLKNGEWDEQSVSGSILLIPLMNGQVAKVVKPLIVDQVTLRVRVSSCPPNLNRYANWLST